MFKINKDLRRLGIVSVSALMLLGVGASVSGVHANVHAESVSSIFEADAKYDKIERQHMLATSPKARAIVDGTYRSKDSTTDEQPSRPDAHIREIEKQSPDLTGLKPATHAKHAPKKSIRRHAKRHSRKTIKRNRRVGKRTAKRAIKGIDASRYARALRKSNYALRHGRRHAKRYNRTAKKFTKANNAEKKAYRKFAHKHTNRNRKAVNKAITNLNNLVNALLK